MTQRVLHHKSGRRRVPFFPDTGQNSGSVYQIYNQISLPENGTIYEIFPSPRESIFGIRSKRVPFCALKKASITVEAAIAIPAFFMAVIALISMMGIYGSAVERAAALRDTAMTTALIAGTAGAEEEQMIDLTVPAACRILFIKDVLIPCRACARVWNGRDAASEAAGRNSTAEYVYITDNMSVYHTSPQCTHLDLSVHAVSSGTVGELRNISGGTYHACEKCGSEGSDGILYVTSYGDCYHTDASCSGLKRTIKLVEKTEIDPGLHMCSRCAAAA